LLWGNVPAEQEGRLSKHLDECAACRQLLESLADGDGTCAK
jgi:predicted anti-sigma-YlaC factor YlaD